MEFASTRLRDDRDVVLAAVDDWGNALRFASTRLCDDRDVVLAAVDDWGDPLQFASTRLRDDHEIVLTAVSNDRTVIKFATERLQTDSALALGCLRRRAENQHIFHSFPNQLRNDQEFLLQALEIDGTLLKQVLPNFQADVDVVLAAVNNVGNALQYASKEMRSNREVVVRAVQNDRWAIKYASAAQHGDPYVNSWLHLTKRERRWRKLRDRATLEEVVVFWMKAIANGKEEHRIKRAKLGHVFEEEAATDPNFVQWVANYTK